MLIHRIHFHLLKQWQKHVSKAQSHTLSKFENFCKEISPEETTYIENLVDDLMSNEPKPEPHRSMLFRSKPHGCVCNFITAPTHRRKIIRAYKWAIAHHMTIFLVDYTTPFGLLALETLSALQNERDHFLIYAIKGNLFCHRKSYRLIPETDIELLFLTAQSDHAFSYPMPLWLNYAAAYCTERGIKINEGPHHQ